MKNKITILISSLLASLFTIILYILHELGHTIVALACGAKITSFSIIGARMSYDGGKFNQFSISLLNAGGMLLPVLLCLIFTLTFNRKITNALYIFFSSTFFVICTGSILAWVVLPFISFFSTLPEGDDVARFLMNSQCNELIVIFAALLLFAIMIITALNKVLFKTFFIFLNKKKEYLP